jgi:hypothetical protein
MEDDIRWKEERERWMRGPQTYKVWSRETEALWAVRDKEEIVGCCVHVATVIKYLSLNRYNFDYMLAEDLNLSIINAQ